MLHSHGTCSGLQSIDLVLELFSARTSVHQILEPDLVGLMYSSPDWPIPSVESAMPFAAAALRELHLKGEFSSGL